VARELWWLIEPVHAVTYFSPESREAFETAGLRGFWRGYFAGRAAPLGPVGAAPVIASFFSFAPSMVERALPDVWTRVTPEAALAARLAGATASLRRVWDGLDGVDFAADLLERAARSASMAGRVLGAANAALPWPTDPIERLWHATTVIREHRGDGHVAALVAAGVDGCEALVWRAGIDGDRTTLQPARGWTDDEWDTAAARLARRGWLDTSGVATEVGRAEHAAMEAATDRAAAGPWEGWSDDDVTALRTALTPLAGAALGVLTFPNPIGLPTTA
jgi:hypothetical protein